MPLICEPVEHVLDFVVLLLERFAEWQPDFASFGGGSRACRRFWAF
jgi:hypothetical protein